MPPLEQFEPAAKPKTLSPDRKAPSPEPEPVQQAEEEDDEAEVAGKIKAQLEVMMNSKEAAVPRQTPVFSYDDDEDETDASASRATGAASSVNYTQYTDLEELD